MVMKVKLNESKFNSVFSDWLKKHGITIDILYWRDNCVDSITGTVYLYKQKEILGYKHGYGFDFKYDKRFKSLRYVGHSHDIEKLDNFKFLPSDVVIKYFSDKVENYLIKYINDGYSCLR